MSSSFTSASKIHSKANKSFRYFLGPALLLPHEDPKAYEEYHRRLRRALKPRDFIEEVWVGKCADLDWQEMRLERFKHQFFKSSERSGLKNLMLQHPRIRTDEDFFEQWVMQNSEAKKKLLEILRQLNMTEDAIYAHTYVVEIAAFESIERRIEALAKRRAKLIQEIERRQDNFAKRLEIASKKQKSRLDIFCPIANVTEAAE